MGDASGFGVDSPIESSPLLLTPTRQRNANRNAVCGYVGALNFSITITILKSPTNYSVEQLSSLVFIFVGVTSVSASVY